MSDSTTNNPTIFFVPGAWHGAWCFDKIRAVLASRNYPTSSHDLASVGDVEPTVGLEDDAVVMREALKKLIVTEEKNVMVVAHSYGGIVASNAVKDLSYKQRQKEGEKGGIIMIVFLAAWLLPIGKSIVSVAPGAGENLDITGKPGFGMEKDPIPRFYNDMDPVDAAAAAGNLKMMTLRCGYDESAYEPWSEGGFNLGYLFTEQDQTVTIEGQKNLTSQLPKNALTWTRTIDSGHSPFLSQPENLGSLLIEAVGEGIRITQGL